MELIYVVLIFGLLSSCKCYHQTYSSLNTNGGSVEQRNQIFSPDLDDIIGETKPSLNSILSNFNDFISLNSQVTSHYGALMTAKLGKIGFFCKFQCKSKCSMKVWRKNCSNQCSGGPSKLLSSSCLQCATINGFPECGICVRNCTKSRLEARKIERVMKKIKKMGEESSGMMP